MSSRRRAAGTYRDPLEHEFAATLALHGVDLPSIDSLLVHPALRASQARRQHRAEMRATRREALAHFRAGDWPRAHLLALVLYWRARFVGQSIGAAGDVAARRKQRAALPKAREQHRQNQRRKGRGADNPHTSIRQAIEKLARERLSKTEVRERVMHKLGVSRAQFYKFAPPEFKRPRRKV